MREETEIEKRKENGMSYFYSRASKAESLIMGSLVASS
jgi:hypothetical protein